MTTATLQRTTGVMVWNASASGALIETTHPLPVGTVGVLELDLDGHVRSEWFRVCRVHRTAAGASGNVVAVEFLPVAVGGRQSLREALVETQNTPDGWGLDAFTGGSSGDPGNSADPASGTDPAAPADTAVFRGKVIQFPHEGRPSGVGRPVAQTTGAHDAHADSEVHTDSEEGDNPHDDVPFPPRS
jgi:hypothetical protein